MKNGISLIAPWTMHSDIAYGFSGSMTRKIARNFVFSQPIAEIHHLMSQGQVAGRVVISDFGHFVP